jgi:DNA gyrase subunit A
MKFKKASKDDSLRCLQSVGIDDEILVITSKGVIVRQKVSAIPAQSRTATGVLVQKVDAKNDDEITTVSKVPSYEQEDE